MTFPAADGKNNDIEGTEILSAIGWKRALGCKYAQLCRFCQSNARICKDDTEASSYCGAYDLFDNFKPSKMNTISQ